MKFCVSYQAAGKKYRKRTCIHFILLLATVILIGAVFRVPGIYWGDGTLKKGRLEHWNVDEKTHIKIASRILQHQKRHRYGDYVEGFGRQIAAIATLEDLVSLDSSADHLYRIGRWLSLFYGIGIITLLFTTVFLVSNNTLLAFLASGFMALNSLAITNSHFATADSANTFWIWATALLCYYSSKKSTPLIYYAAWSSAGLAIAIKFAVVVFAPLLFMVFKKKRRFYHLAAGITALWAAFTLANGSFPGFASLKPILNNILYDNLNVIPGHTVFETTFSFFVSLFPSFSIPVTVLSAVGIIILLKKNYYKGGLAVCIGATAIFYLLLLLTIDLPFVRHLLPLSPLLSGLSALAIKETVLREKAAGKRLLWCLPVIIYLLVFAVEGEIPYVKDNRTAARRWIMHNVKPGSNVLIGPYAWLGLPHKRFKIKKIALKSHYLPDLKETGFIVLHEFHTYRYSRSLLSPFGSPASGTIYHPDDFSLHYLERLQGGELPFYLAATFRVPSPWTVERYLYERVWGTFQSFVGDTYIYKRRGYPVSGTIEGHARS